MDDTVTRTIVDMAYSQNPIVIEAVTAYGVSHLIAFVLLLLASVFLYWRHGPRNTRGIPWGSSDASLRLTAVEVSSLLIPVALLILSVLMLIKGMTPVTSLLSEVVK